MCSSPQGFGEPSPIGCLEDGSFAAGFLLPTCAQVGKKTMATMADAEKPWQTPILLAKKIQTGNYNL